jgi:putative aminopeptidase FrvX
MTMELLKQLSEVAGVPGREDEVRRIVLRELEPLVDEIKTDILGNVIARKKGRGGPRVMIAAHMDEIGFLISHVDEKTGYLKIDPVGGFDARVLLAKRVVVHTESGDLLGAMGSKPVHILSEEERNKPLEIKDLFIDVGLPASKVKKRVQVGDFVTLRQDFVAMGDLVSGKALDDRVGVYVMIEAIRRVKRHKADIYAVATTQEEVGLRGARVSSHEVSPDIGIALDVTVASDVPGAQESEHVTKLGSGVAIKIKDSLSISNPKLVRRLRQIAEKKKIPYQPEILPRGGTDAGAMQLTKEGVAAITLSIPTRYLHSVVESAHKKDIQAAIELLTAFLEDVHQADYSF